jgi:phage-related tail fiber protein
MSTVIAQNFKKPNGDPIGQVPVGTVIMYYGATAPSGYLECDGQSTTGYAALGALIGSNTPDLRGEFVRGWDNSRGVDTGRALGSTQTDEFKAHTHNYIRASGTSARSGTGVANLNSTFSGPTEAAGGDETRPRNIALMYCIKH